MDRNSLLSKYRRANDCKTPGAIVRISCSTFSLLETTSHAKFNPCHRAKPIAVRLRVVRDFTSIKREQF